MLIDVEVVIVPAVQARQSHTDRFCLGWPLMDPAIELESCGFRFESEPSLDRPFAVRSHSLGRDLYDV